jgi:hypothetical protein
MAGAPNALVGTTSGARIEKALSEEASTKFIPEKSTRKRERRIMTKKECIGWLGFDSFLKTRLPKMESKIVSRPPLLVHHASS